MLRAAGLLLASFGIACGPPAPTPPASSPYLESATRAGAQVLALQASGEGVPDRLGQVGSSAGLGTGSAGRAVFLAELFAATGDSAFRSGARIEAEHALAGTSDDSASASLYGGLSGVAFAAAAVGRRIDDPQLRERAHDAFGQLAASTRAPGRGSWWQVNDVIGGLAGIGLALLHGAEAFDDPDLTAAAVVLGDTLLGRGEARENGARRWMRGTDTPFDLPNFSHGTAGVGYFLARLARASGEQRFEEGALAATRYLESIADTRNGLRLVPYGVPNEGWDTPYDLGWAHGPAGTARLAYSAHPTRTSPAVDDRVHAYARTILASGIPRPSADTTVWKGPFVLDRRFGMAGIVPFLVDVARESGEEAYRARALEMADTILARAVASPAGLRWSLPLYGFQGEGEAVHTGYFYGSAGMGLALLEAHHAVTGTRPSIRFPDDPFAAGPTEPAGGSTGPSANPR